MLVRKFNTTDRDIIIFNPKIRLFLTGLRLYYEVPNYNPGISHGIASLHPRIYGPPPELNGTMID